MKARMQRHVKNGLAVAVAAASVLSAYGCGEAEGEGGGGETALPVAAWTVEPEEVVVERQWHGRLEPLRAYAVQAPRAGRVAAVEVRDGDPVRAGQVLVRMEGPDLEARRGVLRERLEFLEAELERWRDLARTGAAGPAEVAQAELRVLELRDETSQLESFTESYLVRAPASGRVSVAIVGPGVNVTDGQLLLNVEDGGAHGVRLVVPVVEAAFLEEVGRLSIRDDRGEAYAVERVVLTSDAHPAFVRADVYVGGAGARRAATLRYRTAREVLTVPWTAVASDGERQWVAAIVGDEAPRVERRTVELGRAFASGVEVRAGLVAGDRVVRFEPRSLPDGRLVEPLTTNAAGVER